MIAALADAGAALGRADYLAAAVACAAFIEAELRDAAGGAAAHVQPRPREAARRSSRTTRTCSRRTSTLYESTFDERWFVARASSSPRRS